MQCQLCRVLPADTTAGWPQLWHDSMTSRSSLTVYSIKKHAVNDIHWMQTAQWKLRQIILFRSKYCPHITSVFRVSCMGSLSTLQVFVLKLSSCPRCQCPQLMLIPWAVMCGVGSHICSDVSSVYLSVPSLSGGGLREGNALSGSNIKYIKWERMGGGGGEEEWAPPPSMGPGGCIVSGSLSVTVSL